MGCFYKGLNKVDHLTAGELTWLVWGAALSLLTLLWYAFRSKALLTQMQGRLTSLTVELKKANHSIAILLNSRGAADEEDLDETKLYVGNIDYSASEKELAAHFAKFGQIETVNIPVDRYSGRARGFGFITFKKVADAIKAMDLDGSEFKGRSIQVNFARERTTT